MLLSLLSCWTSQSCIEDVDFVFTRLMVPCIQLLISTIWIYSYQRKLIFIRVSWFGSKHSRYDALVLQNTILIFLLIKWPRFRQWELWILQGVGIISKVFLIVLFLGKIINYFLIRWLSFLQQQHRRLLLFYKNFLFLNRDFEILKCLFYYLSYFLFHLIRKLNRQRL